MSARQERSACQGLVADTSGLFQQLLSGSTAGSARYFTERLFLDKPDKSVTIGCRSRDFPIAKPSKPLQHFRIAAQH